MKFRYFTIPKRNIHCRLAGFLDWRIISSKMASYFLSILRVGCLDR